jgi:pyruvate kinase
MSTKAPNDSAWASALAAELTDVHARLLQAEAPVAAALAKVHPEFREGAANLAHYVALRSLDLRPLQETLAARGLSSLGRSEAAVLASVEAVLDVVNTLAGRPPLRARASSKGTQGGRATLAQNTTRLLGEEPAHRSVRVMVTLPSEAADNEELVRELVGRGMDCARINTAHDDEQAWQKMVHNLRSAERALGRRCSILMDLGGVKLRTAVGETEPAIIKWRPTRDRAGRVLEPARVLLRAPGGPTSADTGVVVPLPTTFLERIHCGDRVSFSDLRGKHRQLRIVDELPGARIAESDKTCYVGASTKFRIERQGESKESAHVGPLPDVERRLLLHIDDQLILTGGTHSAASASHAQLTLSPPEVLSWLSVGHRIWFDDGEIGGFIEAVAEGQALVRITSAAPGGSHLGSDKGINLPDTNIELPALTEEDKAHLDFVVAHADLVGLSFVRSSRDVAELRAELERRQATKLGLVLKIETQAGFRNLPQLLLEGMRFERLGVMIARGDLAVECGFERLAEVQEEILWLCEAAQVPAIWATQVLESLAKKGRPSRAEITDASTAGRAECVMLNKGPHIVRAVEVLDDILRRMQGHMTKKSSLLRPLQSFHV